MKLASLKSATSVMENLCVVNQALTTAVRVPQIAPTLQYALEHWQTRRTINCKKFTNN